MIRWHGNGQPNLFLPPNPFARCLTLTTRVAVCSLECSPLGRETDATIDVEQPKRKFQVFVFVCVLF